MFKRFGYVYFIIITLLLLGFITYSNILYAPFVFDDDYYIANNPQIKDLSNFKDLNFILFGTRCIGLLSFAINYYFGGLNTFGYHIVNIVIHILNSMLVYVLVSLTLQRVQGFKGSRVQENTRPLDSLTPRTLAFAVSLIFLVHPIQTQAVTYISQRFESLAAFFYLSALVLYVKARLVRCENRKNSFIFYILLLTSYFSAILAMKTKEISFTLPFIIILYEFTFFRLQPQNSRPTTHDPRLKTLFFYLIPYLLTLLIIPLSILSSGKGLSEELRVVQLEDIINISPYEYLITQFRVIVTYIRLLFLPINQNLDYDYPIYKAFFAPAVILSFIFLLSIFSSAIFLFLRSRITHNIHGILISFGIVWFFITLSVTSSIISIKDVIFEHRLYLPSIGFILAAVASIFYGFEYLEKRLGKSLFIYLSAIILAISLSFLFAAYNRNIVWKSEEDIYLDTVNKSPMKARQHNYLAAAYKKLGNTDEAIKEMQIALSLPSNLHHIHHYNLGLGLKAKGLLNDAVKEFLEAVKLKTDYWEAYYHLGMTFIEIGRLEDAERNIKKTIELQATSNVSHLYNTLGNIYLMMGKYQMAVNEYEKAVNLDKNNVEALYNIATAYKKAGSKDKAIEFYKKFIESSFADYKNEIELAKEQIRELQKK